MFKSEVAEVCVLGDQNVQYLTGQFFVWQMKQLGEISQTV